MFGYYRILQTSYYYKKYSIFYLPQWLENTLLSRRNGRFSPPTVWTLHSLIESKLLLDSLFSVSSYKDLKLKAMGFWIPLNYYTFLYLNRPCILLLCNEWKCSKINWTYLSMLRGIAPCSVFIFVFNLLLLKPGE